MDTNGSRRFFCKAAAATALLASSRAYGANKRLNFAVIGCGGMGTGHLNRSHSR
jgi:hypothetical protein